MRDFKGMKRQRGRNRGGGGGGQGGGKPGQNANRAFDSNGPDNVKVRGHAQHVYEKYNQLARDASSAGDRVLAENHLQHAEHYFRTLRVLQPQRPVTEIVGRDTFVNGFDLDFEDEAVETAMEEADALAAQGGGAQPSVDAEASEGRNGGEPRGEQRDRGERSDRGDRPFRDRNERFDRPSGERFDRDRQDRGDRQAVDRPSGDRPSGDRQSGDRQGGDRGERPRFEPRRDRWEDRGDRTQADRAQSNRTQSDRPQSDRPQGDPSQGERTQGDRSERGFDRPRRDRWDERAGGVDAPAMVAPDSAPPPRSTFDPPETDGRVLRSEDGGVSEAPAFLSASPTEDGEPRRPRSRRPRTRPDDGGRAPRAEPETEEV